jgi:hypothetical protein
MDFAVFNLRKRSLLRGTALVLVSLTAAFLLSGFPDDRPSPLLFLPLLATAWGSIETLRCLRRHWNFHSGAVLVLLYSDLLAFIMILFLLVYPYGRGLR